MLSVASLPTVVTQEVTAKTVSTFQTEVEKDKWLRLYDQLELKLKIGRAKKEDTDHAAAYKDIVYAVDELLDRLKSGASIFDPERLLRIIANGPMKYKASWQMAQTGLYAYPYIFSALKDDLLKFFSDDIEECYSTVVEYIKNEKREIREAAAWSLGAAAMVIGDKLFTLFKSSIESSRFSEDEREMEGYQVAVGFMARSCGDITFETFDYLMNYLSSFSGCSSDKKVPSAPVRVQSLKGMQRAISSDINKQHLMKPTSNGKTWFDTMTNIAITLLNDNEITVRKAAASLFNQLMSVASASVLKHHIDLLYNALTNAQRWEHRHGLNTAFNFVSQDEKKVALFDDVVRLINLYSDQISLQHPEIPAKDGLTNSGPANAEAGKAIISKFLTLLSLHEKNIPIADKSIDMNTFYKKHVHAEVKKLMASPYQHLQDAAGNCFHLLLKKGCIDQESISDLLVHGYQNNYGHLAVIQSNIRNFNFVMDKLDAAARDTYFKSLVPRIATWLTLDEHVNSPNPEERECYFKGLAAFFSNIDRSSARDLSPDIIECLMHGIENDTGRNAEYARREAWRALGNYILLINSSNCSNAAKNAISGLVPKIVVAMSDEEEDIVTNAMRVACDIKTSEFEQIAPLNSLLGPILILNHSISEFKRHAWLASSCIFGNYKQLLQKNPSYFQDFFDSCTENYDKAEGEYPEETAKTFRELSTCLPVDNAEIIDLFFNQCLELLLIKAEEGVGVIANCLVALINAVKLMDPDSKPLEFDVLARVALSLIVGTFEDIDGEQLLEELLEEEVDLTEIDENINDKTSIVCGEPTYIAQFIVSAQLLKVLYLKVDQETKSLIKSTVTNAYESIQNVENGMFAIFFVQSFLSPIFGVSTNNELLYSALREIDGDFSTNYQSPSGSPDVVDDLFALVPETDEEDEDDNEDQTSNRLLKYFISNLLFKYITSGVYKPSLSELNRFCGLVNKEKYDEEDEDQAYIGACSGPDAKYLGFFSPEAANDMLNKTMELAFDCIAETTSPSEVVSFLATHLGLIKSEVPITLKDYEKVSFCQFTSAIVNHKVMDAMSKKVLISVMIRRLLVAKDKDRISNLPSYAAIINLLSTCISELSTEDIPDRVLVLWMRQLISVGNQQFHRKLDNAAPVQLSIAVINLFSISTTLKNEPKIVSSICQLLVDSLINENLEQKRNPLAAAIQNFAAETESYRLIYPVPTPLLTVKDNCTFVENRD